MNWAKLLAAICLAGCSGDVADSGPEADGGGGAAGDPGCTEPVPPDADVPKPTPSDIQFTGTNPLVGGEYLLFNDWNPSPNPLYAIRPDGSGEMEVFRAYRLWSLGASHDGRTIAFACGDPLQEERYGINIGDAIQHTWLYDVATQTAKVLAWGNLNDECHTFSENDDAIWVCRRWDFTPEATSKGYQIARLSASCGTAELPTSPEPNQLELYPRPSADESTLHYTIVEVSAGSQSRRIVRKSLPDGLPETLRDSATLGQISPDGTRLVFADHTQGGALFAMKLDSSELVKVASQGGSSAVWSPDGSRIAYLWDESQTCHHVQMVAADGSQADSPTRVRDCGNAFITELIWLSVP